ncbi:hypothetical protein REPUB_Repub12eG0174900 [Reevesia pubescens]
MLPPEPPNASTFWETRNVRDRLLELQDTLNLANAIPWEEKSAASRLTNKINKSKRKRKRIAELLAKERERFDQADREADEWRAREIAKDIASRKVEKMKEIAKLKAKEEKKRLESELELVLIVEKLQELHSISIQKLKKQGALLHGTVFLSSSVYGCQYLQAVCRFHDRIPGHWVQPPPPADEIWASCLVRPK